MVQHADLLKIKQKEGTELEVVSNSKLAELSQTPDHQGIVARVSKYPYETMESLESGLRTRLETVDDVTLLPLVVLVDRLQDPFQFASILRSCECAGAFAVVIGEYCQAQVTTQVARASMGVVNQLVIVQTPNLVQAAGQLRATGLTLLACEPKSDQEVANCKLKRPIGSTAPMGASLEDSDLSPYRQPAGQSAGAPLQLPAPNSSDSEIKSPMIGTLYRAPSPDAAPYVDLGAEVGPDTVVCIIEAMKVMNEIKAEQRGIITAILADNTKPVEFGQPLFRIRPT